MASDEQPSPKAHTNHLPDEPGKGDACILAEGHDGCATHYSALVYRWTLCWERYEREAPAMQFEEDALYDTGFEWVQESKVELGSNSVRASRLTVDLDREDLPEPYRGVHYCKTWSPTRALLWALTAE